nr:hypothetical protein [Actinomadura sp. CNU-125]
MTEAEGRVRGELLDDLLSERRADAAALAARARRVDVDLTAPHVVLSARYESRELRRRAEFWASSFAAVERGLAASRGRGGPVLLLPGDGRATPRGGSPRSWARRWAVPRRSARPARCGDRARCRGRTGRHSAARTRWWRWAAAATVRARPSWGSSGC